MAKMIMSLSFKGKEESMWEQVQKQLNPAYYIKSLIYNDMNKSETKLKEEKVTETKRDTDDDIDLELDF